MNFPTCKIPAVASQRESRSQTTRHVSSVVSLRQCRPESQRRFCIRIHSRSLAVSVTDSGDIQYVSQRKTRSIELCSGLLAVIHSETQGSVAHCQQSARNYPTTRQRKVTALKRLYRGQVAVGSQRTGPLCDSRQFPIPPPGSGRVQIAQGKELTTVQQWASKADQRRGSDSGHA